MRLHLENVSPERRYSIIGPRDYARHVAFQFRARSFRSALLATNLQTVGGCRGGVVASLTMFAKKVGGTKKKRGRKKK